MNDNGGAAGFWPSTSARWYCRSSCRGGRHRQHIQTFEVVISDNVCSVALANVHITRAKWSTAWLTAEMETISDTPRLRQISSLAPRQDDACGDHRSYGFVRITAFGMDGARILTVPRQRSARAREAARPRN